MYIVEMFEMFFAFNVKDNNIYPCINNIKFAYTIYECFSSLSIRMRMST